MGIRVFDVVFAWIALLASSGVVACGTRSELGAPAPPAGFEGGSPDAGDTAEAAPATGPKCGLSPATIIDASTLVSPDGGRAAVISSAMDVAVSATDVYVAVTYGGNGAVLRAPIRGGATSVATAIVGSEQGLIVVGDSVVFAEVQSSPGASALDVVRVGLDGGARTVLASGEMAVRTTGAAAMLASDGSSVYFAAADGTKSVPLAGGSVLKLSAHTGSIAIAGTNVVIVDAAAEALFEVPAQGGAETTLVTGLSGTPGPVIPCAAGVCWASDLLGLMEGDAEPGTLFQLAPLDPLPAGAAPPILASDSKLSFPYRLVFDGSHFFMTTLAEFGPGELVSIPAMGGAVTSVGNGAGLALDDECLYTASYPGGVQSVSLQSF